jgi:hypothetical protein
VAVDNKKIASELVKLAKLLVGKKVTDGHIRKFEKNIARIEKDIEQENKSDKPDKEIIALHQQDKKDLNKILALVKQGKLSDAAELATDLDTSARDQIPSDLYEIITEEYS